MGRVLTVRSRGADDVERTRRRFVPSARLDRVDPAQVGFAWQSVELPTFTTVAYELAAEVTSSIRMDDQIMACRVTGPGVRLRAQERDLDPRHPWLGADGPVLAHWGGTARVRAFVFDRAAAERVARASSGDDGLVLRRIDAAPRDRALGQHWERSFAYVSAALASTHDEPLIAAELERHALLSTLGTFATTYLEAADRARQRPAAPRTVRRALAYIDDNVREPITLDDIARAAGISTRGLQHAFRRALDSTPSEQLRRARLAGAHDDLRAGTGSPVREIARRWGFSSASRFAAYYRAAYGRTPAQTARTF